jgi:hypothetical protein
MIVVESWLRHFSGPPAWQRGQRDHQQMPGGILVLAGLPNPWYPSTSELDVDSARRYVLWPRVRPTAMSTVAPSLQHFQGQRAVGFVSSAYKTWIPAASYLARTYLNVGRMAFGKARPAGLPHRPGKSFRAKGNGHGERAAAAGSLFTSRVPPIIRLNACDRQSSPVPPY